jgi:hypothetical protein
MKVGVLRVNASFGMLRGTYFTLDLGLVGLGFLSVGEKRAEGFVLAGFVGGVVVGVMEGFVKGVVFTSFSSSSCF